MALISLEIRSQIGLCRDVAIAPFFLFFFDTYRRYRSLVSGLSPSLHLKPIFQRDEIKYDISYYITELNHSLLLLNLIHFLPVSLSISSSAEWIYCCRVMMDSFAIRVSFPGSCFTNCPHHSPTVVELKRLLPEFFSTVASLLTTNSCC
jgi:hypothetical protein